MRVLFIAEAFGGGLFEIIRIQAEGLAARGHSTAIAYGVRPETPADVRSRIGSAVEVFPPAWTDRSVGAQARAARQIRRMIKTFAPDVVHLQSSFAGVVGEAAVPAGMPTVYTPQGYSFAMASAATTRRLAYRMVEAVVAQRVDVVAACSYAEALQARTVGATRVVVVENGIPELDPAAIATLRPDQRVPNRVIAVGRAGDQRRPEACARMLSSLGDVADVAWIGGGSPGSPGLRALDEAGIPVTGWLDRSEIMLELQRATVYLHWTGWDGLPLSILEALAHDVIVIASDIGPNREVLGPAQVCGSEAHAASLIRGLLHDASLRAEFAESQRVRRGFYAAGRMTEDLERLYIRLLEHGPDTFSRDLRREAR